MDIKNKLNKILIQLRSMEVKGENNVLILAQTFVDLEDILRDFEEEKSEDK